MKNSHKSNSQITTVAAFFVGLLLAGCASAPEQRDKPSEDADLGLYGVLRKNDGRYSVAAVCRKTRTPLPEGASKYPECKGAIHKNNSLYFDLVTLAPTATSDAVCMVWGAEKNDKPHWACEDYKDIHKTDVGLNVLAAPFIAVGTVLNAGTKMATNVQLDEDAFRREIEIALPTARRLALIEEERTWRNDFPVRKVNEQQQAQLTQLNAQRAQAERQQVFASQVRQASVDAEQRFSATSATNKPVGTAVCSADNRLGYVEQQAGGRIKILIKGHAVAKRDAVYGHGNPLGPFKVDTQGLTVADAIGPQGAGIELPILDPYYLFKPHSTIRLGGREGEGEGEMIWDDGRQWGTCSWRF